MVEGRRAGGGGSGQQASPFAAGYQFGMGEAPASGKGLPRQRLETEHWQEGARRRAPLSTGELTRAWLGGQIRLWLQGRVVSSGSDLSTPALAVGVQVVGLLLVLALPVRFLGRSDGAGVGAAVGVAQVVLSGVTLTLFALTACSDPGILPRCARAGVPVASHIRPPAKEIFIAHGRAVQVRFCDSCNVYQPPGTEHCSVCANCVRRFDHHCPWVCNCVGARNYAFFFGFVCSSTLTLLFAVALCAVEVARDRDEEGNITWTAGAAAVIMALLAVVWLFVLALLVTHVQILLSNASTKLILDARDGFAVSFKSRPEGFGLTLVWQTLFGDAGTSLVASWVAATNDCEPPERALNEAVYGCGNDKDSCARKVSLAQLGAARHFPVLGEDQPQRISHA